MFDSTPGPEEYHENKFTGWFIPREIVELFENGTLSAKEVLLLAKIDGLSHTEKGCFASNEYLGKCINMSTNTARRCIRKLRDMGLVVDVDFDGRKRYLKTVWTDMIDKTVRRQGVQKRPGRVSKSGQSGCPNLDTIVYKSNSKEERSCTLRKNRKSATPQKTSTSPEKEQLGSSGKSKNNRTSGKRKVGTPGKNKRDVTIKERDGFSGKKKEGISSLDEFAVKWAGRVRTTVKEHDPFSLMAKARIQTFAKDILKCKLERDWTTKRIEEVLEWYCDTDNYGNKYTPKIHKSGDLFHLFKRIEDQMSSSLDGDHYDAEIYYQDARTGKWYKRDLLTKLRSKYLRADPDQIHTPMQQDDIDVILLKDGMEAGSVSARAVSSG